MVSTLLRGPRVARSLSAAGCAALLFAGLPASALSVADPTADMVRADLVAASDALAPGSTAWVGLRLQHAPHWHTYWAVPGDAGLPTRLRWQLPAGFAAGDIAWPVPSLLPVGGLANYGYEGRVLLPVPVRVPASAAVGSSARLAVRADWLVCSDLCVPGGADLELRLPVRAAADVHPSDAAQEFAEARRHVPAPDLPGTARATLEGEHLRLEFTPRAQAPRSLQFFPLEANRIVAAAPQALKVQGRQARLELQAAAPVEADFKRLVGVLVADGGPGAEGWAAQVDVALARTAGARAAVPAVPAATPPSSSAPVAAPPPVAAAVPAPIVLPPSAPPAAPAGSPLTWLLAMAGAFVGGLILNLMPCVFPVLSLKLMALMQHRGESPARLRAHGAAYAAGAIASFVALAALLIALRAAGSQVGWGFQLQSPPVIGGLIALFFLIGLNLLGVFEITAGAGLANSRAAQALGTEGLRGTFATGVLAAVVASPCTAPFMGAALGFAATQPAATALLVFAALGAGMAAPYVLLTLAPALLARLPRPGAWMERLKQVLAFPMFLTCVWLYWVLGQQVDMDAVAATLAALVALAFGAWIWGLAQRGAARWRWAALAAVATAVALFLPLTRTATAVAAAPATTGAAAPAADWAAWSPAVQSATLAAGRPVFVDFTAAWCITCQANKRIALHDERVETAFAQAGVVRLRADWTRRDEAIARELERFGRSGVPMYVLYDRHGVPQLLPEILSPQIVLDALAHV